MHMHAMTVHRIKILQFWAAGTGLTGVAQRFAATPSRQPIMKQNVENYIWYCMRAGVRARHCGLLSVKMSPVPFRCEVATGAMPRNYWAQG